MLIPDERNRLGSTFNQSVAAFVVSEIADVLEGVPEERVEEFLRDIFTDDAPEYKDTRDQSVLWLVEALQVLYWEGPSFYAIRFTDVSWRMIPIRENTDAEIVNAKDKIERWLNKKLPKDDRTGFPSFTVYENGQEIGGG